MVIKNEKKALNHNCFQTLVRVWKLRKMLLLTEFQLKAPLSHFNQCLINWQSHVQQLMQFFSRLKATDNTWDNSRIKSLIRNCISLGYIVQNCTTAWWAEELGFTLALSQKEVKGDKIELWWHSPCQNGPDVRDEPLGWVEAQDPNTVVALQTKLYKETRWYA